MANNLNSDSNSILRTILIILIVVGIAYLVYYLYNQKKNENKNSVYTETPRAETPRAETINQPVMKQVLKNPSMNVDHYMQGGPTGQENPIERKVTFNPKGQLVGETNMEHFSNNEVYAEQRNNNSFPKDQLSADELLPSDNSSLWAQVNPAGEGSLKDRNFLQSGYHIGINTVGQTLRNANLQLRSEPPCPQVRVSPWIQSTIEPDVSRLPFEIGGCA